MKKRQIISISCAILLQCFVISGCGISKADITEAKEAVTIFAESENAHFIMTSKPEGQPVANTWEYWCDSSKEQKYYVLQTSYDDTGKERYRTGQLVVDGTLYTNMNNMLEEKGEWENEMNLAISESAAESFPTQMFETAILNEDGAYKSTSRKNLKDGTIQITLTHGKDALEERNKKLSEDSGGENPMEFRDFVVQVVMDKEKKPKYFQEEYTVYREEQGEIKDSIVIELKALNDDKVLQELERLTEEAGIER